MADYEANLLQGPFPVDLVEIGLSCRTSVLCVAKDSSKIFVAFKLVQEIQRKSLSGYFTLIITENTSGWYYCLEISYENVSKRMYA